MQKLTIPLLATSLFLIFGCASKRVPDSPTSKVSVENPYFSDASKDYTYRTKITVYEHELNGILIAKKISDSIHRVVLTTDFGNTLLDFEVGQTTFQKNNIVEDLDRKIVVNTLRDDFRLLFRDTFLAVESIGSSDNKAIYKLNEGKTGYTLDFTFKNLVSISKARNDSEKVFVGFEASNHNIADKIDMQHRDMQLHIEMTRFYQ